MSRDAAPRSVPLSGVQAAVDFIDAEPVSGTTKIAVLHNLDDGRVVKSDGPMETSPTFTAPSHHLLLAKDLRPRRRTGILVRLST
jgi:hypothetical protein